MQLVTDVRRTKSDRLVERQFRPSSFHPSVLAWKSERVLLVEVARLFFTEVDELWCRHGGTGGERWLVLAG